MRSTDDVIDNHLKCFAAGDLEGIVSDYAPDAVLFTPQGPLEGVREIRGLFEAMLAEFAQPGSVFEMGQRHVHGDHAYILWSAQTPVQRYELGTDTFVVRGGRIAVQSFAAKTTPRH